MGTKVAGSTRRRFSPGAKSVGDVRFFAIASVRSRREPYSHTWAEKVGSFAQASTARACIRSSLKWPMVAYAQPMLDSAWGVNSRMERCRISCGKGREKAAVGTAIHAWCGMVLRANTARHRHVMTKWQQEQCSERCKADEYVVQW